MLSPPAYSTSSGSPSSAQPTMSFQKASHAERIPSTGADLHLLLLLGSLSSIRGNEPELGSPALPEPEKPLFAVNQGQCFTAWVSQVVLCESRECRRNLRRNGFSGNRREGKFPFD